MRLVVGLGNPGAEYVFSRHNLGFRVVERAAERLKLAWRPGAGPYLEARSLERGDFALVKPTTYMNASGEALGAFALRGELVLEELLVVVDDLDLPTGQLRLRRSGSDGGHRGLRSIIAALGSGEFARLRVGIASPRAGRDAAEFVLDDRLEPDEVRALDASIDSASEAVILWRSWAPIEELMNRFNRRIDRIDRNPEP